MTYRANKSESESLSVRRTAEQERAAEQLAIQGTIRHLEKQLDNKRIQFAEVNHAFVRTQEKVLEAHKQHQSIAMKTTALQNELTKAEGMKLRLRVTAQTLQTENNELTRDHDLVRLQLKKSQEALMESRAEAATLQSKLADAGFLFKAKQEEYSNEIALLRAELVKIKTSRNDASTMMVETARDKSVTERKIEFLHIKYENACKEIEKYAKLNAELQKKMKDSHRAETVMERQHRDYTKQFEVMFNKEIKARATLNAGKLNRSKDSMSFTAALPLRNAGANIMGSSSSSNMSGSADGSVNSSPHTSGAFTDRKEHSPQLLLDAAGGGSKPSILNKDASFLETLMHEMRKQLHRASTLAAERLNELTKLRHELKLSQSTSNDVTSREHGLVTRIHRITSEHTALSRELLSLRASYGRAECIAASFEVQLRNAINELNVIHTRNAAAAAATTVSPDKDGTSMDVNATNSNAPTPVPHTTTTISQQQQPQSVKELKQIDYRYLPDVEPSPLLRAILEGKHNKPDATTGEEEDEDEQRIQHKQHATHTLSLFLLLR